MSDRFSRRSLLLGLGGLIAAQFVSGCGRRSQSALGIQFLEQSLPTSVLREFRQQLGRESTSVQFTPADNLSALYDQLMRWQRQPPNSVVDWITIGDYWLTPAIQNHLIAPIDLTAVAGWDQLPEAWQALVKRDRQGWMQPMGEIWGAPYRWGSLVFIYRTEAFEALGWMPTDWDDLWRPDLQRRISLLDSPRSVIGLVLKRLGHSFNTEALDRVSGLTRALSELQKQVKLYSSSAYLQPLLLGDTWLAVGWSTDVLPILRRDRRYGAVIPTSGTALTADLWVRPAPTQTSTQDADTQTGAALASTSASGDATAIHESAARWIEFCWQPQVAQRLSLQTDAASPVLLTGDRQKLPAALQDNALLLPARSLLDQSEFLAPLTEAAIAEYERLWTAMRLGNLE